MEFILFIGNKLNGLFRKNKIRWLKDDLDLRRVLALTLLSLDPIEYKEKINEDVNDETPSNNRSDIILVVSDLRVTKSDHHLKKGIISYWRFDLTLEEGFKPLIVFINIIGDILELFWKDIIIPLPDDQIVILQLVGHGVEIENFNITYFVKTNKGELELIKKYFKGSIEKLSEKYLYIDIKAISFKYYMFQDREKESNKKALLVRKYKIQKRSYITQANPPLETFSEANWDFSYSKPLPSNNKYKSWGEIVPINKKNYVITLEGKDYFYIVKTNYNYKGVETIITTTITCCVGDYIDLKKELFKVKDVIINKDCNTFTRTYYNNSDKEVFIEIYEDTNLIFKSRPIKCNYISKINSPKVFKDKFLTIDLETVTFNNILTPISVSFYDGEKAWSFNISKFHNFKDILTHALDSIINSKYNGWCVYLHNFSRFDAVFLLNILVTMSDDINILKKEGDILDISFTYGEKKKI